MLKRLSYFVEFIRVFARYALYVRESIMSLLLLIVLGGFTISKLESIKLGDAMYFAFITGLTIGYGDITPQTAWGRVASVAIGLVGVLFVGLTVAIATRALADTVKHNLKDNR
jgi:voltage-gated potassium channel